METAAGTDEYMSKVINAEANGADKGSLVNSKPQFQEADDDEDYEN